MKRILLILAAAAIPALAQTNNYISTSGTVSLAAATYAVTLQQPAQNGNPVTLQWATVYCSAACVITQSVNCTTAATATAGTIKGTPGNNNAAARATFWTASNASGCTALTSDYVAAGQTFQISFPPITPSTSPFRLPTAGTTSNYHISIASVTADVKITIGHGEPQ